ncbi:AAA family ATPase [Nesterenkonia sp. PF2B19]|uniref:AAA family ATPase n=1 Tax=Nesterenkonia sp. PF2B19 TaxID=1881858 RepID=UPI0008731E82|nr:AAA family ATPase [Nesterenkonia sp. PF2B19]OSM44344.1 hypothetical protein BCY76_003220 [Nesterenkonia sp. PF2B19]
MATVTLLNGAPASGKSTLAGLLARDRAMTLVLDVDSVRGALARWEEDPTEAGWSARRLALAMCECHLAAGHDVIVPQFLQREEFIDQLEDVAAQAGARFLELCLVSSRDQAAAQFDARAGSLQANHRAATMLQSATDARPVEELYDAMIAMIENRPQTLRVNIVPGDVHESLIRLRDATAQGAR